MVGKEKLSIMSKPLMTIVAGSPGNTVEIDRRYVIPRLAQYVKTYVPDPDNEGKKVENKVITYFDMVRCKDENFQTAYEKNYYRMEQKKFQYCVKDQDVYMQGTRDSAVN